MTSKLHSYSWPIELILEVWDILILTLYFYCLSHSSHQSNIHSIKPRVLALSHYAKSSWCNFEQYGKDPTLMGNIFIGKETVRLAQKGSWGGFLFEGSSALSSGSCHLHLLSWYHLLSLYMTRGDSSHDASIMDYLGYAFSLQSSQTAVPCVPGTSTTFASLSPHFS